MAREVRRFTASFSAGTTPSTPQTFSVAFAPRIVRTIDWRIPPGAQGVLGWHLAMGGVQVIPTLSTTWVIDDGTSGTFYLDGYPDSGAWQLVGYNTGVYPHSVFLVFHLDLPEPPKTRPGLINPVDLAPVPDLSRSGAPVKRYV